jgi:uncharacterized protein YjbI with pentapeptide repeats
VNVLLKVGLTAILRPKSKLGVSMAKRQNAQTVKPSPIHKKLTINLRELLVGTGQLIFNSLAGNIPEQVGNAAQILNSLSLETTPAERGWQLIETALLNAVKTMLTEQYKFNSENANYKDLAARFQETLLDFPVELDVNFLKYPKTIPLLERIKPTFQQWLLDLQAPEPDARMFLERFAGYFAFELHIEWGKNPSNYKDLLSFIDTPFAQYDLEMRQWAKYSFWLQQQIDQPVFGESFSLRQVYIPLRGYYIDKQSKSETLPDSETKPKHHVVMLEEYLESWLDKAHKDDAIRIICGGPGSGKSSLTKVLAANLAEKNTVRVVFIPLHRLNLASDLTDAVNQFAAHTDLPDQVLHPKLSDRTLFIFDGLDELAIQGKVAVAAAGDFLTQAERLIQQFNHADCRIQIIVAGREFVIQHNESQFRKPEQILHVLPYKVEREETRIETFVYHDSQSLLAVDQRQLWWGKYGQCTGQRNIKGLPDELSSKELLEITAQPLLNYLVALSLARGKLDFKNNPNLNQVYADLLDSIYQRVWDTSKAHPTTKRITQKQFERILEEIAISSWHGNGRTTTVSAIETRLNKSNLKSVLDQYIETLGNDPKAGITNLMTAFYFRQSAGIAADKTFEFTHKSFSEYLIARRFLATMKRMYEKWVLFEKNDEDGWNEIRCLKEFFSITSETAVDEFILQFLRREIQFETDKNQLVAMQKMFAHLIGFSLKRGFPLEELIQGNRSTFQAEVLQARNTEEALFVAANLCARMTQERTKIKFPTPNAMGNLIRRVAEQRNSETNPTLFDCLSFTDLNDCTLHIADLYRINLENSSLQNAYLYGANLERANLVGANLVGANLRKAHFELANLGRAHLGMAYLSSAYLGGANLTAANLTAANLERANLERAHLEGANLEGANLREANLTAANLEGANLEGANLTGAKFRGARNLPEHVKNYLKTKNASE